VTRDQQEADRELARAELRWLHAYGWTPCDTRGDRLAHRHAPKLKPDYSRRDAMQLTRAEPLRYTVSSVHRPDRPEGKRA